MCLYMNALSQLMCVIHVRLGRVPLPGSDVSVTCSRDSKVCHLIEQRSSPANPCKVGPSQVGCVCGHHTTPDVVSRRKDADVEKSVSTQPCRACECDHGRRRCERGGEASGTIWANEGRGRVSMVATKGGSNLGRPGWWQMIITEYKDTLAGSIEEEKVDVCGSLCLAA